MNYQTINLNDLFYMTNQYLTSYYQTSNKNFLQYATISYYWYKKRKGLKVIDRLENELIKNELEYI